MIVRETFTYREIVGITTIRNHYWAPAFDLDDLMGTCWFDDCLFRRAMCLEERTVVLTPVDRWQHCMTGPKEVKRGRDIHESELNGRQRRHSISSGWRKTNVNGRPTTAYIYKNGRMVIKFPLYHTPLDSREIERIIKRMTPEELTAVPYMPKIIINNAQSVSISA